jgi:uncharacterized protein (UPF0332 family)
VRTPLEHIEKARALLDEARFLLEGDFIAGAGRDAYLAGYHAASVFVIARTGKEPKTHRGARTEFSRMAHGDARVSHQFVRFLARGYELKTWADYDDGEPLTIDEVSILVAEAAEMVEGIAALV